MWWTALLMGLAGSLHCAGMCSPLAMVVTSQKPFLFNKIVYNTGRIFTYGILGVIAASFGSLFMITPYQGIISFIIGALFLLMGIGAISGIHIPFLTNALTRFTNRLKSFFHFWLSKKSILSVLIMGMLNGLLPCGLTYLAMTYCFIMPTMTDGFWFMILFGAGTWPVMIGFTWLLGIGFGKLKLNYQRITTVVFIMIGVWLLARVMINHPMDNHLHLFDTTSTEEVICP
jgi:sulfite exporter TauE/SafE